MKRFSKKNIIDEIQNGNEEVLGRLSQKHFPSIRRLLRIRGIRDSETPQVFSHILATVFINLSKRKTVSDIDFEEYLLNSANDYVKNRKQILHNVNSNNDDEITAHCVSILDEHLQKLLFARVVEKLSYEKIAERFQYSNAVIAQYELDKAFQQLEGIVKLRLNVSLN